MFRTSASLTVPTIPLTSDFCAAMVPRRTKVHPSRIFGQSHPLYANYPPYALTKTSCLAQDPCALQKSCGQTWFTASSYRPPAKPLAARPFSRPCDLRNPRSIRRGIIEPTGPKRPTLSAAQGPQPIAQELHIQFAGANLFCGHGPIDSHRPGAADFFPGHTATAAQNPRAGSLLCVYQQSAIQLGRDTQSSRAHVFGEIQNQTGAEIHLRPSLDRNPATARLKNLGNA